MDLPLIWEQNQNTQNLIWQIIQLYQESTIKIKCMRKVLEEIELTH